jgi:hypothetical protein
MLSTYWQAEARSSMIQKPPNYNSTYILAIVVLIGVATYLTIQNVHFSDAEITERVKLFTDMMVGVGTLALAAATFWNIRQTNAVIAGEERRFQVSEYPLVTLSRNAVNIDVMNIGKGIALNIDVALEITDDHPYEEKTDLTSWAEVDAALAKPELSLAYYELLASPMGFRTRFPRDLFISTYRGTAPAPAVTFPIQIVVPKLRSDTYKASYYNSSLTGPNGEDSFTDEIKTQFSNAETIKVIQCTYNDMFGNQYGTKYIDDRLERYIWIRPRNLSLTSNE